MQGGKDPLDRIRELEKIKAVTFEPKQTLPEVMRDRKKKPAEEG